ncbi:hypothetical protein QAD02_021810 [Eretmocerus hayati]|uniref:Uncharacterized protein n=1 Tax=Eretmocerus hayati TaxID=131215 RepID=A0ACC2PRH9_9HYME|nr:hypothetical protein QAD02_021810 [Eretmocerus hayati]
MGKELMLFRVRENEEIFCVSCHNKGPLEELYAKCEKCSSTYHPSCAERAELRDDGSFRKCCQEEDSSSYNESVTSADGDDTGLIEDGSKSEELSDPESIGSTDNTKNNEENDTSDELLMQIHKLIRNELKKSTRNINDNIDTETEVISSKIDCLNVRVDGLEEEIIDLNSRITVIESAKQNQEWEMNDNMISKIKERIYRGRNIISSRYTLLEDWKPS